MEDEGSTRGIHDSLYCSADLPAPSDRNPLSGKPLPLPRLAFMDQVSTETSILPVDRTGLPMRRSYNVDVSDYQPSSTTLQAVEPGCAHS